MIRMLLLLFTVCVPAAVAYAQMPAEDDINRLSQEINVMEKQRDEDLRLHIPDKAEELQTQIDQKRKVLEEMRQKKRASEPPCDKACAKQRKIEGLKERIKHLQDDIARTQIELDKAEHEPVTAPTASAINRSTSNTHLVKTAPVVRTQR